MTPTTCYMERPAAVPMAAPMGAVGLGRRSGFGCSMYSSMPVHAAAAALGNAGKPWAFRIGRQVDLTTNGTARHLGRRST